MRELDESGGQMPSARGELVPALNLGSAVSQGLRGRPKACVAPVLTSGSSSMKAFMKS
eukprot:CAMPEP_0168382558 /NCGR_PEP_ID=MMETSP0228-20121227/13456_1 /TAXON_ID=133427 /ORGANISM="Protoceratium reticulatum, Strain CCCM 535 (=CCMP 1889)" /LENGTH=57 /DNA_ID=CAMNT_0008395695 /DNA_START=54 /DNA_END=222 /DNA_ORIENTATION=+